MPVLNNYCTEQYCGCSGAGNPHNIILDNFCKRVITQNLFLWKESLQWETNSQSEQQHSVVKQFNFVSLELIMLDCEWQCRIGLLFRIFQDKNEILLKIGLLLKLYSGSYWSFRLLWSNYTFYFCLFLTNRLLLLMFVEKQQYITNLISFVCYNYTGILT